MTRIRAASGTAALLAALIPATERSGALRFCATAAGEENATKCP